MQRRLKGPQVTANTNCETSEWGSLGPSNLRQNTATWVISDESCRLRSPSTEAWEIINPWLLSFSYFHILPIGKSCQLYLQTRGCIWSLLISFITIILVQAPIITSCMDYKLASYQVFLGWLKYSKSWLWRIHDYVHLSKLIALYNWQG